ncbi:MAG TPA: RagB/SusD family nutrient uptake outer membrane protein [Puia sp.]|nr:RagB/SusD family nutrient uptake outer membrane protein [Puia sp.]
MKRIKYFKWTVLIAAPLLALTLTGCKKFLDRKPLTGTYSDANAGALDAQSFGLYSTLRTYAGFSSLPWLDFHSIRDDDAQKGSSTTDGAEIDAEFETFKYTKDDWATDTYWNDHFTMISLANQELHLADSLHVKDPASLRNVGEACFFRAYSYFELVKAYGDVPLLDFYSNNPSDYNVPKSPASKIYQLIDSDLNVAIQYLPETWNSGTTDYPGRVTNGAARALAAQTHIFRSDWAAVKGYCSQIIASGKYSLLPNFVDIWKDGLNGVGKNSAESIFEEQSWVGENGGFGPNPPYYGTAWGTSQQVRQGGAPVTWNLGWGWNVPTQNLVDAWNAADSNDPRKFATILYSGQYDGGPATGGYGATLPPYNPGPGLDRPYWNKKVYSDPQMRTFTGEVGGAEWINHRIIRYADVILMMAEASNELGDGATAADMVNMIRRRARGSADSTKVLPPVVYTTQAAMRTAIKNERRWEFAMEGSRFYDLVRWGDALSVLGGLGYQAKNALYPIPQPAIDLSGGKLVQNPLYP